MSTGALSCWDLDSELDEELEEEDELLLDEEEPRFYLFLFFEVIFFA